MPENSDDAKKIVQLGDYRARRTSRVDASDEIDEYEEDDSERFIVNFTGSPDEIFVQFVDWLSGDPDIGAIITVRPQLLTLEDEPNEDRPVRRLQITCSGPLASRRLQGSLRARPCEKS